MHIGSKELIDRKIHLKYIFLINIGILNLPLQYVPF